LSGIDRLQNPAKLSPSLSVHRQLCHKEKPQLEGLKQRFRSIGEFVITCFQSATEAGDFSTRKDGSQGRWKEVEALEVQVVETERGCLGRSMKAC